MLGAKQGACDDPRHRIIGEELTEPRGHVVAAVGQSEPVEPSVEDTVGIVDLSVTNEVNPGCWHSSSLDSAPGSELGGVELVQE